MTTTMKADKAVYSTPWWLILLQGIAAIILGALLLLAPGQTTVVLIQFLGIYWLISGIFALISIFLDSTMWGWKLFTGILGIIAGILILQHPLWSTVLVPTTLIIVLGIMGLTIGFVNLIQAFRGGGWGIGILGILSIIFGFLLIINPLLGAVSLPFVVGIFALLGGFVAIIQAFRMRSDEHTMSIDAINEGVTTRTTAATSAVAGTAAAVVAATRDTADSVGDSVSDAVDDAQAGVASAVDSVEAKAAGTVVAIDSALDSATSETDTMVDDTTSEMAQRSAGAVNAFGDTVDNVQEGLSDTAESIGDGAAKMVDDAKDFLGLDNDTHVTPEAALAAVSSRFPDWPSAEQRTLATLFASIRQLDFDSALKLKELGIQTVSDLLERGGTRQGRVEIGNEIDQDPSTVLTWVNDADLSRIKGIGVKYSDLLETAGVDTVVELAQRNPQNLYQKLVEVNAEMDLVIELPTEAQVVDWVAQAKELPRAITY